MADKALVLGIGNILWSDEGFGVRAVEYLHRHYQFDENVRLMDGGTQGVYLVHHVQDANILLVFDAVDYGLTPGTIKLVEGADVPKFLGAKKMSLHQTGFQEVLALAEMLGKYPQHLLLIGVQPEQLEDYGGSLTPVVQQQIEPAIRHALEWLQQFDITATCRAEPLPETESLAGAEVSLTKYEKERPAPDEACRVGDERVLKSKDFKVTYRPYPLDPDSKISCDVDHRGQY